MRKERRRFLRASESLNAQYHLIGELSTSWMPVTTINISAVGARIRHAESLEVASLLELQIQLPGARKPLVVRGCVIWSRMQASGVTESGVDFLEMSEEQQWQVDELVRFLGRDSSVPPAS